MKLKKIVTLLILLVASFLLVVEFNPDEVSAQQNQRPREPITQPTDGPVSDEPAPQPQPTAPTYTDTIPANDNLGSRLNVSYTLPKLNMNGNIKFPTPCWSLQGTSVTFSSGRAEIVYTVKDKGGVCAQQVVTVPIRASGIGDLAKDKLQNNGLSSLVTARRVVVQ